MPDLLDLICNKIAVPVHYRDFKDGENFMSNPHHIHLHLGVLPINPIQNFITGFNWHETGVIYNQRFAFT